MVQGAKKRGKGRPLQGEGPMRQIAIRFPEPMLEVIDAIVARRLDRPDRTAVIRELVAEALEARKAQRGR